MTHPLWIFDDFIGLSFVTAPDILLPLTAVCQSVLCIGTTGFLSDLKAALQANSMALGCPKLVCV